MNIEERIDKYLNEQSNDLKKGDSIIITGDRGKRQNIEKKLIFIGKNPDGNLILKDKNRKQYLFHQRSNVLYSIGVKHVISLTNAHIK